MKRTACLTALLLLAGLAQAASLPSHILDRVTSACVMVHVSKGREGSSGSGFFVAREEVVTNAHVVEPAIKGEASIQLVVGTDTRSPELVDAQLVTVDEELDLALLRTEHRAPRYLRFEPDRRLRVTDPVWVVGFPFGARPGLEPTVTAGTISSLRHDEEGELTTVQVDAAVNRGNSGGPVVNDRGRVLGLTRATINPKVGSGMALAIPSGVTEDFVDEGQRIRHRSSRLSVRGDVRGRGYRIVKAEKQETAWGVAVRITARGYRDTEELAPVTVDFQNRRRDVVRTNTLDFGTLKSREEKTITFRLRGVDYEDIARCEITE